MKLMHNGIIEVDHVRPEEVTKLDDHLPASWFGPFTENNGTVKDMTLYPTIKSSFIFKVWSDCHEEAQSLSLNYGELH